MPANYKGINIQFGGDTTDLKKAIAGANSSIKELGKEIKGINDNIKLDPTNMDAFAQKSELLGKQIAETDNKLKMLSATQEQFSSGSISLSDDQYLKLQGDITETENKLQALKNTQEQVNAVMRGDASAVSAGTAQAQYRKELQALDAQLRLYESEMTRVNAVYAESDKSAEAYNARMTALQGVYDAQKQKVETLSAAVQRSAQDYGENSKEVIKWQTALNNAQASLADTVTKVDELGQSLEKTGNKASIFGDMLKANIAADLVKKALSTAINFAQEGAKMYADQAQSQAKLAQVMRTTMGASDDQADSIVKLTKQYEKMGVVSKTVQVAGAQELATYISKQRTLESLLPVMNNMLAQQYGINATQENAVNIASMLGKVMDGQVGALSRYGYAFDDVQSNILKTGTESEKVAVVIDIVTGAIGNMNEELGKTDMGKYAQQTNEMADAQMRIGEEWQKAQMALQTGFMPVVTGLADAFTALPAGMQQSVLACVALASAGYMVSAAFGPVGLVIAGIGALGIAAFAAYKKTQEEAAAEAEKFNQTITETKNNLDAVYETGAKNDALVQRLNQLNAALDSGTLSADDAAKANDELKKVKQDLINLSQGRITAENLEKGAIESNTEAIKAQKDAYTEQYVQALRNKVDSTSMTKLNDELTESQERYNKALADQQSAVAYRNGISALADEVKRLKAGLDDGTVSQAEFQAGMQDIIGKADALSRAAGRGGFVNWEPSIAVLNGLNKELAVTDKNLNELGESTGEYKAQVDDVTTRLAVHMGRVKELEDIESGAFDRRQAAIAQLNVEDERRQALTAGLKEQGAALEGVSANINRVVDSSKDLQSAYDSLSKGQTLNQDQLLSLIDTYPELAKYIKENGDFTFQNGNVVKQLIEIRRQEAIQMAQTEIDKTKDAIEGAKKRITALKAEASARLAWWSDQGAALKDQAAIDEAQKEVDDLTNTLTAAEAGLAVLNSTSLNFSSGGGGAGRIASGAAGAAKSVRDTNDALTEQLAKLDHRKKMGQVSTQQEIDDLTRIQKEYARSAKEKENLDERLYALRKTLRDKAYQEELKRIAEMKQDKEVDTDYGAIIAAYEKLQKQLDEQYDQGILSYDGYEQRYQDVSGKISDSVKAQAAQLEHIFQKQTGDLQKLADETIRQSDRIIAVSKAMSGLKMPDGSVFSFTPKDELNMLNEQLATAEKLKAKMQTLADQQKAEHPGYKLTEAQLQILEKSARQVQDYKDKITDLTIKTAQGFQAANTKLTELNAKVAEDQKKINADYASNTAAVTRKLNEDLTKAANDYNSKLDTLRANQIKSERQVTDAYNAELEKRVRSLSNFTGLFSNFVKKDMSGQDLLQYLENQLGAVQDFQESIQKLADRGVTGDLLQELTDLGPKSANEIAALNTLTDDELQRYIDTYNEKNRLARAEAEKGMAAQRQAMNAQLEQIRSDTAAQMAALAVEYNSQMDKLNIDARGKLDDLKSTWSDALDKIIEDSGPQISQLQGVISDALSAFNIADGIELDGTAAADAIKSISAGIQDIVDSVTAAALPAVVTVTGDFSGIPDASAEALKMVADTEPGWKDEGGELVKSAAQGVSQTTPALTNQTYATGVAAMQGLANGIANSQYMAEQAAAAAAQSVAAAIAKVFEVSSPSRLTQRIGKFVATGLAMGMIDSIPIVEYAAKKLGIAGVPRVPDGAGAPGGAAVSGSGAVEVHISNTIYVTSSNDLPYQVDRANQRSLRGILTVLGQN